MEIGDLSSRADVRRMEEENKLRSFLQYWLWLWPGLSLLCFVFAYLDPAFIHRSPQDYWVCPLIGMSAAGWSWARTFEVRYVPPAIVSAIMFGVGMWLFLLTG